MAASKLSTTISCILLFLTTISSFSNAYPSRPSPELLTACNSTRFPQTCLSHLTTLLNHLPHPTPSQIINASLSIANLDIQTAVSFGNNILQQSKGDSNSTAIVNVCLEILSGAAYRVESSNIVLNNTGGGRKLKDVRAWLGAALHYQYSCFSSLSSQFMKSSDLVNQTVSFLGNVSMQHISNTLSMVRCVDIFGDDLSSWSPPMTERSGFWERRYLSGGGERAFVPQLWNLTGLAIDLSVCRGGVRAGCLSSIQDAVNSAPDHATSPFVIHIKAGRYRETVRIPLNKSCIVFIGDGMGKTIISGSLSVGITGLTTYNTATVGVNGDGFMAMGVTFENTAGPEGHQAVAFRSDSDLSFLHECEFIGNQDTLYASTLRQYYSKCRIQGNVDFIFGNSFSFFNNCNILVSPRHPGVVQKQESDTVTAHGRTDPGESTGFVFENCVVNGTNDDMGSYWKNPEDTYRIYLGRPWKEYSRTVFLNCSIGGLFSREGWMPWNGEFALETLYYGEFKNTGPGADRSGRVEWSSEIPAQFVGTYSLENFIDGGNWFPSL